MNYRQPLYSTDMLTFSRPRSDLWIDAICINPANKVGQSHQVSEMGRVLNSASRVIFWLGTPTREATLLMNVLDVFMDTINAITALSMLPALFAYSAMCQMLRFEEQAQH